jgi:hypothetical protein
MKITINVPLILKVRDIIFFSRAKHIVLDIKSQYIPEVVVVRRGAVGVLGGWRGGGSTGWRGTNGVSLQATWEGGGQFLTHLEGAK